MRSVSPFIVHSAGSGRWLLEVFDVGATGISATPTQEQELAERLLPEIDRTL